MIIEPELGGLDDVPLPGGQLLLRVLRYFDPSVDFQGGVKAVEDSLNIIS